MTSLLTKKATIDAEKQRLSQLTNKHDAYFKLILSHQIDKKHNFHSISTHNKKPVPAKDTLGIFRAFGKFIDESVKLTITDVEKEYRRPTNRHTGTYDPESGTDVQVEHYCLYKKTDKARPIRDGVRLHGYLRTNGGYFVVTKLDWFHSVDKKGNKK